MDLRKFLSLCVAALLIAGFSSQATALDVAEPGGIWIRVTEPDSGNFAKIADTVRVQVLTLGTIVDDLYVGVVTDTSATQAAVQAVVAMTAAGDGRNSTGGVTSPKVVMAASMTGAASAKFTVGASGTAVDTFGFKFAITTADTEFTSASKLKVAIWAKYLTSVGGPFSTSYGKLTALDTDVQVNSNFSTPVGDNNQFSVDGKRPITSSAISGGVIDSVRIDTTGVSTTLASVGSLTGYGIGDKLKLNLYLNTGAAFGANAKQAKVVLVDTTQHFDVQATIDSAVYTYTFDNLFVSPVKDSTVIAEGDDWSNAERMYAVAFLEDAAGNLSGTSATAAAPSGLTNGTFYIADAKRPTIKPLVPSQDSITSFTARIDTTFAWVDKADGSLDAATTFTLNPLKILVDEGIPDTKVFVTIGSTKDTLSGSPVKDTAKTFATGSASGATAAEQKRERISTTQAGKTGLTVKIEATDSLGNSSSVSVTGVTFDEVLPKPTRYFPGQTSVPTDEDNSDAPTINEATVDPIIRLSETVDSLVIQYVEKDKASGPDTLIERWSSGHNKLDDVGKDGTFALTDTLLDGSEYTLQIYFEDVAGNIWVTGPDTMTYTKDFDNPIATNLKVDLAKLSGGTAANDSVIAGEAQVLTLTAIDTSGGDTVTAVTYKQVGDIAVSIISEGDSVALADMLIWGTGVSIAATDSGMGMADMDVDGWVLGQRDIRLSSQLTIDDMTVSFDDTVNTIGGVSDTITVDAAELYEYAVTAMEEGVASTGVSGDFQVHVVAVDRYGNPSMKAPTSMSTSADSQAILDSRVTDAIDKEDLLVQFGASEADASVPPGPQSFDGDAMFTVIAPDRTGDVLIVSVRTFNATADSTGLNAGGTSKYLQARGTVTVGFVPFGEEPVVPVEGAPAAPDTLLVQDWMGADGEGDQGGFVAVSFPPSDDHAVVSQYRLSREMLVTTGTDSAGNVVTLTTAVKKYVPWTVIDAVPVDTSDAVVRAVVPTLDNVTTKWGIAAEKGGTTSERTVAKRVFTLESVQQMVQLLGVAPERVLTNDELIKQFNAPKDYVKSILGDQKNVVYAALDPDLNSLLGTSTVKSSIRTEGGKIIASTRTISEEAAAVDNIPPTAVTDAKGSSETDGVALSWTTSADDKIVAFSTYRGMSIPIAGVDKYQVLRGTTNDNLAAIGTVEGGVSSFSDTDLPQGAGALVYRVDALDLDNATAGAPFSVVIGAARQQFVDANDNPVYIVDLVNTPGVQDFNDFISFAQAYLTEAGQAGFNVQADTNDDGIVNFSDFIAFAQAYLREVAGPAAKLVSVPTPPGVNDNVEMSLSLISDRVLVGQTVSFDVSLANTKSLYGYGLTLTYDPEKFELVDAVPAENDMLKAAGGETPLFLKHTEDAGQVTLMNAVINGDAASGDGSVVTVTFKVLREFEDNARFEIADGLVFDPNSLSNPVVTLGALSVETTPTEFALLQNYPNPFNPETTIKYNLAEGANVQLRIYNIVGQVVKTMVGERQSAGRYQVRWNGTDDRGVAVSSGIYFYQISAGKFQDVKRLMLLK